MPNLFKVPTLLFFYLGVWFFFGLIYQREANRTRGAAFAFNQDVRTGLAASIIYDDLDRRVSEPTVRSLIASDIQLVGTVGNYGGVRTYYALQPIGPAWARFYSELFQAWGVTYYSIEPLPPEPYPFNTGTPIYFLFTRFPDVTAPVPPSDPYLLRAYSGHPNLPPITKLEMRELRLIKEYKVWLSKAPFNETRRGGTKALAQDLFWLPESLQHSLVYLDDTPMRVREAIKGTRSFPLVDFLYFSAVTITTLGFGDIAPNNQTVRILVMVESFLGLLVIGGLVSALFSGATRAHLHSDP